ncbi:thiol:disulfide interchange protein TlpA [Terrihabitans soli]|nr:TlpA disulfide reductase family protein [Terrihabitans soli]
MPENTKKPASVPRKLAIFAIFGAFAGIVGVYLIKGGLGNDGAQFCSADRTMTDRLKPLARGEVAAVLVPDRPRKLPELGFKDASGKSLSLKDFAGKTLLVNMWATWCAPCREEMPALDSLQGELGGPDFQVVAVSIDTQQPDKAKAFLNELKIAKLGFFQDASGKLFQDLKLVGRAVGLPTTLLIDKEGCEIGYLPGPAHWASEDAKKMIRAAIGR